MRPWTQACVAVGASAEDRVRRAIPVFAAAVVIASPGGAAGQGPSPIPPAAGLERACGVNGSVDQLLGCLDPPGVATAGAAGAPSDQSGSSRETTPTMRTFSTVQEDPSRLIVRFERRARQPAIASALRAARVEVERQIPPLRLYGVRVDPSRRLEALRKLEASPVVASAEREVLVSGADTNPNDDNWSDQDGLRKIGLPKAWDLSHGSEQVVVAVVDTGVDASHADLARKVLPGYDFANGDADASDDHGHGTAVAGVIAARADNGEGIAGVCWLCRVLPVKVLGADGTGPTTAVAAGVVWAADRGAAVINLSLGGPEVDGALDEAVAYARSKGSVVVAAAGNNGVTMPFFPAASPGAIGVAGTDASDRFYAWSNRGQWVAVSAPGCNATTVGGGGYAIFCGTSSAAPLVAGLAALALARNPLAGRDEIERAIVGSAVPIGADVRYGRVYAPRALELVPPAPATTAETTATVTLAGAITPRASVRVFRRTVGAGPLSATLRSSARRRLTLELVAGDGTVLARAAGHAPLELRHTVPEGRYTLRVSGRPAARAPFTLEVSHVAARSATAAP
jgi:subtilisin family serine protease